MRHEGRAGEAVPSHPDLGGAAGLAGVLAGRFGFTAFRPGQREVVERLLRGRSTLAVFPTGAGKSLCYQLPALLLDGVTLVISPLIALMKDQVDALRGRGIPARRLDSSLPLEELKAANRELDSESLKLLYVAPERLANERFLNRLGRLRIALLAIDEAHCISEWGHNFRPDYLKIARLARDLEVPRVLALTATATPKVAADIRRGFGIAAEDHVQTGFHRPNLTLRVTPAPRARKDAVLLERLRAAAGPAIVYVTRQKTAEEVARSLAVHGIAARAYHAGMDDPERDRVQEAFMRDEVAVVVATIAFGMGIDKADIRAVLHYNLPKTLESYMQEIGRAGRDGLPSVCELLASAEDTAVLASFTYGDTPDGAALAGLVGEVLGLGERFDVSIHDLAARHDIRPLVVGTALTYLELEGILRSTGPLYAGYRIRLLRPQAEVVAGFDARRARFLEDLIGAARQGRTWLSFETQDMARRLGVERERVVGAVSYLEERGDLRVEPAGLRHGYRREREVPVGELAERLGERFLRRERQDIERLERVLRLARAPGCLARELLAYFGETLAADCGACTSCREPGGRELPVAQARPPRDEALRLVREVRELGHEALGSPRALARFLCGITSPAASRARLNRSPRFGCLAEIPFPDVLGLVEECT